MWNGDDPFETCGLSILSILLFVVGAKMVGYGLNDDSNRTLVPVFMIAGAFFPICGSIFIALYLTSLW